MSHTPGPWKLGSRKNAICDAAGTIIANCEFSHSETNRRKPTGDQSIANAALIAAAPEILEALKAMLDVAPFAKGPEAASIHRIAEAAIAKAEGKERVTEVA